MGQQICCLNYLMGSYRKDRVRLFLEVHNKRMNDNGHRLQCGKLIRYKEKKYWSKTGTSCPARLAFQFLEILRTQLYKFLSNLT